MQVMTWRGESEFTLDEIDDPTPGPDQVVVQVEAVGVCGTDVHITQGLFPATAPQILGHEGSGTIVAVGAGVPAQRVGERVVMDTTSHCGQCENCRTWQISRCEHQQKSSGFYAELALVPASCAHPLPADMSFDVAALTEPAACCLQGVERLDVASDAKVLIIGGGIMGLLTLALLRRRGVGQVLVSEPVAGRREAARALGADYVHDPAEAPLETALEAMAGPRGVQLSIEAVGKPELVARCAQLTAARGEVMMIGVCPEGSALPVDLFDFHYRELRLSGAFGRGDVFARTPEVLAQLPVDALLSGNYRLDELPRAIAHAAEGRGVKLLVRPNLPASH